MIRQTNLSKVFPKKKFAKTKKMKNEKSNYPFCNFVRCQTPSRFISLLLFHCLLLKPRIHLLAYSYAYKAKIIFLYFRKRNTSLFFLSVEKNEKIGKKSFENLSFLKVFLPYILITC